MLVNVIYLNWKIQSSHHFGNCGYNCGTESEIKSGDIILGKISLCALPVARAVKLVIKR